MVVCVRELSNAYGRQALLTGWCSSKLLVGVLGEVPDYRVLIQVHAMMLIAVMSMAAEQTTS